MNFLQDKYYLKEIKLKKKIKQIWLAIERTGKKEKGVDNKRYWFLLKTFLLETLKYLIRYYAKLSAFLHTSNLYKICYFDNTLTIIWQQRI